MLRKTIRIEGYEPAPGEAMQAGWSVVLPGFHSALGIPLLRGRDFSPNDRRGSPFVVVVNESFARRFYGSADAAIGRRIGWGRAGGFNTEIIGVVGDFRTTDLKSDQLTERTFTSYLDGRLTTRSFQFYLRTADDPAAHVAAVQGIVSEMDPSAVVEATRTLDRQVEITHSRDIFMARLSAAFAALATFLTAVGLYGITASAVARRKREILYGRSMTAQFEIVRS